MDNKFFIVGPVIGEDPLYFNNPKKLWVEFEQATGFEKDILAKPLPQGWEGILEMSKEGKPLGFYRPSPEG